MLMDDNVFSLKKQLEAKDTLIRLKDDQVKMLENSLSLKDDQIKTIENSLKIKDDKAKTLEKTIELKDDEIRKLASTSIDKNVLKDKDAKIQELEKELAERKRAQAEREQLEEQIRSVIQDVHRGSARSPDAFRSLRAIDLVTPPIPHISAQQK